MEELRNRDFAVTIVIVLLSVTAITGLIAFLQNSPSRTNLMNLSAPKISPTVVPVATSPPCDPAHPISFVSARWGYAGMGNTVPAVVITWGNCANKPIEFSLHASAVNVTLLTYGTTSTVWGYLEIYLGSTQTAPVSVPPLLEMATSILPINAAMSPNATIEKVTGTIEATDPVTGQSISIPAAFAVQPAG